MANNVVYFAVHADDVSRARDFYKKVFGWKFEAWGPPDFYLVTTGDEANPGIRGALQRRHQVAPGEQVSGYECTISVDSVDETARLVEANGGVVIMPKAVIPGVGWLIRFRDCEGNVADAMRYDSNAK